MNNFPFKNIKFISFLQIASFIFFIFAVLFANSAFPLEIRSKKEADFIVNNSIFVLYHEIGHLLIAELKIPILGREENAADNFATLQLLSLESEQSNKVLIDSANGWFLSAKNKGSDFISKDQFYGEHSLDVQRAYQIVCLMVGKDPVRFSQLAKVVELDEYRRESCQFDYKLAMESWNKILEPYKNKQPAELKSRIFYDRGERLVVISKLLKERKFLENVANIIGQYDFPNEFNIRAKLCNEANAFYDSWVSELIFCYELTEFFLSIFDENNMAIKLVDNEEAKEEIVNKSKSLGEK